MNSQMYHPSYKTSRRISVKSLILFLLVTIILTILSLRDIGEAQKKLDLIMGNVTTKIVTAETMVEMIKTVDVYARNIILITDEQAMRNELQKLQGARNIYDAAEARLERIFTSEEDKTQIARIIELRASARPMVNHVIELGLNNKDKEAVSYLLHEVVPANERRLAALNSLIKRQQELSRKNAEDIRGTHSRSRVLTIVLAMLALGLGISTYIFLPSKIKAYYEGPSEEEVAPRFWS